MSIEEYKAWEEQRFLKLAICRNADIIARFLPKEAREIIIANERSLQTQKQSIIELKYSIIDLQRNTRNILEQVEKI